MIIGAKAILLSLYFTVGWIQLSQVPLPEDALHKGCHIELSLVHSAVARIRCANLICGQIIFH